MRTKNNIVMKTKGGMLYSGSGLHRTAIHRNLRDTMKSEKAETSVNNAVFGKILGNKKDSDATKIGSIGTGEHKVMPFVRTGAGSDNDDVAALMAKISFKEKKKRNNIQLII
jgi:hypothetical protein